MKKLCVLILILCLVFLIFYFELTKVGREKLKILKRENIVIEDEVRAGIANHVYYQILYENQNYTYSCEDLKFADTSSMDNFFGKIQAGSKDILIGEEHTKVGKVDGKIYELASGYTSAWVVNRGENRIVYCSTLNKDKEILVFITSKILEEKI